MTSRKSLLKVCRDLGQQMIETLAVLWMYPLFSQVLDAYEMSRMLEAD